jgi:hypothetical protein
MLIVVMLNVVAPMFRLCLKALIEQKLFLITLEGLKPQINKITDSKSWGLYYKTFYGSNLRIFVIS